MTTRLLATIEGVFCAVPLRDQLSNLITHTQYIADRNIYAAILDRQQWDKLREEYWATGRQCDHGRLVPDIDFVASDGKSFLDFEACRKHEHEIAGKFNFSPRPNPSHLPDYQERCGKEPLTEEAFIAETKIAGTSRLDTLEKIEAEQARVAAQIDHLDTVTPPQTLEDRMLVVVGSNYMNLSLVASLLKVKENAVRAVAESSDKFKLSGTGKSIAKTDTP